MMNFVSFRNKLTLAFGLAAAALALNSCSTAPSPSNVANRLEKATSTQVYSFNDQMRPELRTFESCGPIPERAHRALVEWVRTGERKDYSYARPQYFVELMNDINGKPVKSIWSICSDSNGNLVGVLVPKNNLDARSLPTVGNYDMYVCETSRAPALSEAIMVSMAPCDAYRSTNRAYNGLKTISKPLTKSEQEALAETKRRERVAAMSSGSAPADTTPTTDEPAADSTETTTDTPADTTDTGSDDSGFDF